MPSIFTLEGPKLGCTSCPGVPGPIGATTMPAKGKLVLFAIGGAALLGVAWHFLQHDKRGRRRGLRGPSMLSTIAKESKTAEQFARRAEAWNAAEADPLPVAKLAKAFKRASPSTVARLIREAHDARTEGRERLWSKMSRGLRAYNPREGRNPGRFSLSGRNAPKLKIGDLVAREEAPTVLYRVTNTYGKDGVRLLPYRRQGNELVLVRFGHVWAGGGSKWMKTSGDLGAVRTTLGPRGRNV